MDRKPRILVFTGKGKGKTTAALGMALRACGHGMATAMIQFVKADEDTGELIAARDLKNFEIIQSGLGWVPASDDPEFDRHREAALNGLALARECVGNGSIDLLILDEVCFAVSAGLLDEGEVTDLFDDTPPGVILVLTGRDATGRVIERADTVTEMRCVKHGLEQGREAQRGVEM